MSATRLSRTRVVVAKPGLDGHDRGAKIIARALREHPGAPTQAIVDFIRSALERT